MDDRMRYPLNVEARYPTYKQAIADTLSQDVCKQLIADTEVVFKWIKQRL